MAPYVTRSFQFLVLMMRLTRLTTILGVPRPTTSSETAVGIRVMAMPLVVIMSRLRCAMGLILEFNIKIAYLGQER